MTTKPQILRSNLQELASLTREIIPFRFLSPAGMDAFALSTRLELWDAGATIMEQGDAEDRTMYLLVDGSVEVLENQRGSHVRTGTIEPGHYFGEWESIFDPPRARTIRAIDQCKCIAFDGATFMALLAREKAFAQAVSNILRERHGIFRGFELFAAELARGVGYGHISINKLLPLYRALEPALHPGIGKAGFIDVSALDYAIRRLPHNVTSTFAFLIRDELPAVFAKPDEYFPAIATDARRRAIWEILPGKDLVIVRVGDSDLTDFVTCLCLYAAEAQKIRKRIYAAQGVRPLRDILFGASGEYSLDEQGVWDKLGFSETEARGITRVWPKETARRLWEIVNHREMFSIDVRTRQNAYNITDFGRWSQGIGHAVRQVLGCGPEELDDTVDIHIISSNTHSVTNCLNPWIAAEAGSIEKWLETSRHPLCDEHWFERADLHYSVLKDYFRAFPDRSQAYRESERASGIVRVDATASTGIEVQVINLGFIAGQKIDSRLGVVPRYDRQTLVVNIDFAFGEQAEHIIHQLILLFGKTIRSVNFLGKAGSLVGKRGDLLIPTAFLEQTQDLFMPVNGNINAEDCAKFTDREIFTGPMLTVKGTLLQNRVMLQFYKRFWSIVGIEMEGVWYHRQVVESAQLGLLAPNVATRFCYYVSDLPLDAHSNLSERLKASEGVPPLYAITRAVLAGILGNK